MTYIIYNRQKGWNKFSHLAMLLDRKFAREKTLLDASAFSFFKLRPELPINNHSSVLVQFSGPRKKVS
jgi:hypothetical protein